MKTTATYQPSSIHPSHELRLAIRRASSPLSSYPLPVARRIYAKWHLLLVLPETVSSGSTPRRGHDFTETKPHLQKTGIPTLHV